MAVLDKLERAEGLTGAERSLARYILAHADEVTNMGIAALARQACSSNATIIRLCRKLDVAGYRALRVELAADVEHRRATRRDVDVNRPFDRDASTPSIMGGIASVSKQAIDMTYCATSPGRVEAAARLIRAAPHTYLFASGDTLISSIAFANMLRKLGIRCIVADEFGELAANVAAARPGDAALVVSYSGKIMRLPGIEEALNIMRGRGGKMIWVSAAPKPAGADVELLLPPRESEEAKLATFFSQMSIRYLFNCLYSVIYMQESA